ncbi:MAG TPA: ATP synthase F0 subunit B [Polyangiaceae bacterium]|nr:ATP synthase F0 subunit B [Polyangiaceae bacterium]
MLFASLGAGLLAAGVAPQAINVDIDLTFVVQVVLFVALTLVLKPVLFDPMLRLFEERERRIEGAKVQARKIDDKSASALGKYEAEMTKARMVASAERDRIRAEGLSREQQILGSARAASAKVVDEGKRTAHAEAERVRRALKSEATEMARDIASRVLGREVQP